MAGTGVTLSFVGHAGLLAGMLLLLSPRPFDSVPVETIAVDLVPETEIVAAKPEPKPEPELEKPNLGLDTTPAPSQPQAAPPPPQPVPQPRQNAANPQPLQQQPQPAPVHQPQPPPAESTRPPSVFDPASIPTLLNLAAPGGAAPVIGFDAAADTKANLTREEIGALRAHLRKCWKLPTGIDANLSRRVVLRVFFHTNGKLAAEPMLIEASAAREGPALVQAATRALQQCQPYALPAERYDEWKVLDLSFSPREMAGG